MTEAASGATVRRRLAEPAVRMGRSLSYRTREPRRRLGIAIDALAAPLRRADLAIFHEFEPPPGGGGHQFLRALCGALERRGLRVENNRISATTSACLFNSFNFDFDRLRRLAREGCRMVHRVDGPIAAYRGFDDGTDARIVAINGELADATIFQSEYSLERHRESGLDVVGPCVIRNTVDPSVFNAHGREPYRGGRKLRLITTSWSDNPRKGAETLEWLEKRLDWSRYEYTFAGRSPVLFDRVQMLGALPPAQLAGVLREHDVFLALSHDEPCSNALLEALACGLPAVYRLSGGNPELVGEAGLAFSRDEEIADLLQQAAAEWERLHAQIRVTPLEEVTDRYLAVLRGRG
jgi:glycosyltransferase involved in cell wall biosynthesis